MTEKDLIRVLKNSVGDVQMSPSSRAMIRAKTNASCHGISKWRVGLVLVIVMLMATAVAGAWSLSRRFFETTAQMEFQSGYYDEWSLQEKRDFVGLMAEYGLIDNATTKRLRRIPEDELDEWMGERYGINGRTDVITLIRIAEVNLGSMEYWSNDTWVWFNELELRIGQLSSMDPRVCVTPGEEALAPEAAIAVARQALAEAFDLPIETLENAPVYWTYEVEPEDAARDHAQYYIRFDLPDGSRAQSDVLRDGTVDDVNLFD